MAVSIQMDTIQAKLERDADKVEAEKYTKPTPVPLNKSCYINAKDCQPTVSKQIFVLY